MNGAWADQHHRRVRWVSAGAAGRRHLTFEPTTTTEGLPTMGVPPPLKGPPEAVGVLRVNGRVE